MSVSELSASSQNYLKVVFSLQEWSDDPVTPSVIAARVGVQLSTASDAIKKLSAQGLLDHQRYGAVSLTAAGRQHAVEMVRRHRLIESFLVQVLDYRWDEVHDEAEVLEHAVSDLLIERIDQHLGHPTRDPHGDPIPRADGTIDLPRAVPLSEIAPGTVVRIERISDDDPGLLQFFADRGLGIGVDIEVQAGTPYSGAVEVVLAGAGGRARAQSGAEAVSLGQAATDSVWVTTR